MKVTIGFTFLANRYHITHAAMLLALSLLLGQKLRSSLTTASQDHGLIYLTGEFWDEYGSPEVRDFPLLASPPWKLIAIIAIYLYLIAALLSKRPLHRRAPPWRAPVILLLNGSQLGKLFASLSNASCNSNPRPIVTGLHGAWFLGKCVARRSQRCNCNPRSI